MTRKRDNKSVPELKALMVQNHDQMQPLMQWLLQQVLEQEMTEALGAAKGERCEERQGYRSGYYPRRLVTRVGTMELRVPQDRQGRFSTALFARYQRSEKALLLALADELDADTSELNNVPEAQHQHVLLKALLQRLLTLTIENKRVLLCLDEPAAGLSAEEIRRLGALIKAISRHGVAVLLVEHHADLIFDICDRVTVLNLGKVLAAGTPAEIRSHREVVSAYLGA